MKLIGIDDLLIGALVEAFYARVLSHPQLGPVFDARLAGRWPDFAEMVGSSQSAQALSSSMMICRLWYGAISGPAPSSAW